MVSVVEMNPSQDKITDKTMLEKGPDIEVSDKAVEKVIMGSKVGLGDQFKEGAQVQTESLVDVQDTFEIQVIQQDYEGNNLGYLIPDIIHAKGMGEDRCEGKEDSGHMDGLISDPPLKQCLLNKKSQ
jgi:hypothetical protein